jgi:hypothetical protein
MGKTQHLIIAPLQGYIVKQTIVPQTAMQVFCMGILVMCYITRNFAIYTVYIISILKSRRLIWTGHIYQCTEGNI